jgi:hypothetical protein
MIWASAAPGDGASFYVALPSLAIPVVQTSPVRLSVEDEAEQVLVRIANEQGELR